MKDGAQKIKWRKNKDLSTLKVLLGGVESKKAFQSILTQEGHTLCHQGNV